METISPSQIVVRRREEVGSSSSPSLDIDWRAPERAASLKAAALMLEERLLRRVSVETGRRAKC
jgi:hypothetical protein